MTILIMFLFGSFRKFKHYYQFFIRQYLKSDFPNAVFYNRFVELERCVFIQMKFFLNFLAFGRCTASASWNPRWYKFVTILGVMPTMCSKAWLLMGKERWAGVMVSNCIWSATTGVRSSLSVSPVPTWMTGIRGHGLSWSGHSTGSFLPTGDTFRPNSSTYFLRTEFIW